MRILLVLFCLGLLGRLPSKALFISNEDPGLASLVDAPSLKFIGYLPQTMVKAKLPDADELQRYEPGLLSMQAQGNAPKDWFPPSNFPELASQEAIAWEDSSVLVGYFQDGSGQIGRFDLKNGNLLAALKITGKPKAILLSDGTIYVAVEIPEAKPSGMLYAINASLSQVQAFIALDGHPWSLAIASEQSSEAGAPLSETATPSPTPSPSPSPTPSAYLTPTSPFGALSGSLQGQILDAQSQAALEQGLSVDAINGRGKHYPAKISGSNYNFSSLPWGRYSIEIKATGYQSLDHPDVLIAGKRGKLLNFELEPSATP
jgi:hypothetical protein